MGAESVEPAAVTDDVFLGGSVAILQPKSGYRAGIDAVLLAASAPARSRGRQRVLDMGAGVGTVGLCLARRIGTADVTLLEFQPELAEIARRNIARNSLEGRARVVEADIGAAQATLARAGLQPDSFDHALANPPFHADGRGTPARDLSKAAAHAMAPDALALWVRVMARFVKPRGAATMIHKAEALGEILAAFDGRFGAIKVLPIHPRAGDPAIRVIVRGTKGSRAPMQLLSGFVLHGEGGGFTRAADAILRHGAALDLRYRE
jgi:FkbM family methyltransferase